MFPGGAPVLVANFGLVSADAAGRWHFACEAGLGALAARARESPTGAIFAAGDEGLVRFQPACGTVPLGAVPGQAIFDVVFDAGDGSRLRVLGASPRSLYQSTDGGAHFLPLARFDAEVLQLAAAPSRPDTVYAAGEHDDGRFLLLRSDDGGRTFTALPEDASPAGLPLALAGIHPADPEVLFLIVRDGAGQDTLWRSSDGGRAWAPALSLPALELLAGFTFGATGDTVFVASRQQFADPAAPPAHLHVSRDGGRTFAAGLPTSPRGPRYRCLGYHDGVLYACAGGAPYDDDFLLGSSRDEGRTWTPLLTTATLAGPEPCLAATCSPTSQWLCDTYGLCGRDAGVNDAATTTPPAMPGSCGCRVGGPQAAGPALAFLTAAFACLKRRRGRRTGRELS